jgi:hypothetical protein
VFAVAAATVAGWLLLFVVLLVLPPASQPVPGVPDGYLAGQSAVLYAARCTVTVSIHGAEPAEDGPGGDEAALIRLLSLVAGRLPGLVARP